MLDEWLLLGAGVALLGFLLADVVVTTLAVRAGAGLLTGRLLDALWRLFLRAHRRGRRRGGDPAGGRAGAAAHDAARLGVPAVGYASQLTDLTTGVATGAEQHLAFPVLRFFHGEDRRTSAPLAIAVLDETLLLLRTAVAPQARPEAVALDPLRRVLDRYLLTALGTRAGAGPQPPPGPDLDPLRDAGIPVLADEDVARAVDARVDRRTALRRLVEDDGWGWPG